MMRKYNINIETFLNEDDVSYYLLGAIMSDGNIITKPRNKRIRITSKDKDWLEGLLKHIGPEYPIHKDRNHYCISFSNLEVLEWLLSKGCVPNKSKTLQMPNIPNEFLPDFVRGYFDGDGSVSLCKYDKKKNNKTYTYNKLSAYICTGSENFAQTLSSVLKNKKLEHTLIRVRSGGNTIRNQKMPYGQTWRLQFNGKKAKKLFDWTHYNNHKISMPRKYRKILAAQKLSAH